MKKMQPCIEADIYIYMKSVCILRPGDNLQNGATLTQRRRYGA